MRSVLTSGRDVMNANLYNTGYGNAVSNAFQNNAGILGAAQGLGSLAGAATGVNTGLGNLGQNIFAAGLTPYNLTTQGVQTLNSAVPGVGSSYSGTSSGTSSGTTDQSQGLGTIASGFLGAYLMGRRADGGAVMPAYEGHQRGIHDRLHSTVKALHGMMRSEGGAIPRFAFGGGPDGYSQDRGFVSETDNDPGAMAPMTGFMPTSGPALPSFQAPPAPAAQPGFMDTIKSFLPSYDQGVWAGEKASPMQRFGMALTQVGKDNPFAGFGKSAFEQSNLEEQRRQQERIINQQLAQQAAIASGVAPGYGKTLAAQSQPSEIALREAQAKAATVQSDKEFLLNIEKQKMEFQKQLQLEQQEREWQLLERLRKQQEDAKRTAKGAPLNPKVTYEQYRKPDGTIGVRPVQE